MFIIYDHIALCASGNDLVYSKNCKLYESRQIIDRNYIFFYVNMTSRHTKCEKHSQINYRRIEYERLRGMSRH